MSTQASQTRRPARRRVPFDLRMVWTWDHSTNWMPGAFGSQNMGASNVYTKRAETFLVDYMRLIDFLSENGFDAVGIAGFFRDAHGGEQSARTIAEYGLKKGVKVMPIFGLCGYGGIYYEGNHRYSLEKFLADHPELIGVKEDGSPMIYDFGLCGPKPVRHACPSRKEVLEFVAEGIHWVTKHFPIAGMLVETGDTGTCQCSRCRDRRTIPAQAISTEDMVMYYHRCAEAAKVANPEVMMILETYAHFAKGGPDGPLRFGRRLSENDRKQVARFPPACAVQWYADLGLGTDVCLKIHCKEEDAFGWDHTDQSPYPELNIMRTHYSSNWGSFRHDLAIEDIRMLVVKCFESGVRGISMFGESAADHPTDYLNYRAFQYFSAAYPIRSVAEFMRDEAAAILGGVDKAQRFVEIFRSEDCSEAVIDEIRRICSGEKVAVFLRWAWLGRWVQRARVVKEFREKLNVPPDALFN